MDYKVVVTRDAQEDLERFIKYRIVDNVVFVDDIFHELQDYENKMH